MQERSEAMEQAMAYVCCPAEESRVKVQRYCRKIYELGYVPICPRFGFLPFLDEGEAEDQQAHIHHCRNSKDGQGRKKRLPIHSVYRIDKNHHRQ